ncbi:MAG: MotA/TolQ/ExbB proton channel family protein [Pirellulales bacterium]
MLTSVFLRLTYVGAEWVLWLLLLLSFISVALIVERCLYFYLHRIDGEDLAGRLQELLQAGDVRGAWELVESSDCFECGVVAAGLESLRKGTTACQEAMLSAKARLKPLLDARLAVLATIGSNAPFIGLLGTVLGIIKAAHDLTGDAAGNPNAVMAGVFEALVATAVGLFVAIPAVIGFNLLQRKVRTTIGQADSLAHLVLASVRPDAKPAAPAAQRPLVAEGVR